MDNISFYREWKLRELYLVTGVKLLLLLLYSPDLNPIEEYLREVKYFIRKEWYSCDTKGLLFGCFLKWCISEVGVKRKSAEGHFRYSGITIEYP